MSSVKSCSLTKNLIKLTDLPPKPVVTWDMHERIKRNKEIWGNPDSIVHRLPKHYQEVENLINNERNDVAFLRDIGRISYFHEKSQFIMIHRSFAFIGTQRGMYNWKRRFHTFFYLDSKFIYHHRNIQYYPSIVQNRIRAFGVVRVLSRAITNRSHIRKRRFYLASGFHDFGFPCSESKFFTQKFSKYI
jgi:hypothetical protein